VTKYSTLSSTFFLSSNYKSNSKLTSILSSKREKKDYHFNSILLQNCQLFRQRIQRLQIKNNIVLFSRQNAKRRNEWFFGEMSHDLNPRKYKKKTGLFNYNYNKIIYYTLYIQILFIFILSLDWVHFVFILRTLLAPVLRLLPLPHLSPHRSLSCWSSRSIVPLHLAPCCR